MNWQDRQQHTAVNEDHIFVIAGEISASLYGAALIEALKKKRPSLRFFGCGADSMVKSGLVPLVPFSSFQVMGIGAVLYKLPQLISCFYTLKRAVLQQNPACIILIDQPSFSLRLAKSLRKSGYKGKIVQYVAPTIWAYKKHRLQALERDYDLLLVLFSFEAEMCKKSTLKTLFCGHPLLEVIPKEKHVATSEPLVALFPGSRTSEIKHNLKLQLDAVRNFSGKVAISVARTEHIPLIENIVRSAARAVDSVQLVLFEKRYELMQQASYAIAKSGTVTLELALFQVPTVVTYSLSLLNYLFAKYIFRLQLPYYCIVNIVFNKEIFPECIGYNVKEQMVAHAFSKIQEMQTVPDITPFLDAGNLPSTIATEAILELLR